MRFSKLFSKTKKEFPRDEESTNAKLLIKSGFIQKMSAGVYSYLPLGWRVIQNINNIIREEMNAVGGQEMAMPALVAKNYWETTGRWNTDVVYKIESRHGGEFGLGWTHEEIVTALARSFISSYKDLPLAVYQIQTKFRAEPRAKSGLLRGREFLMKDLYSFHADEKDLDRYYWQIIGAYNKILKRLGLNAKITEAAGGAFTKEYTHEFQVLHPVGEDVVYYCDSCDFARNKEITAVRSGERCPKCHKGAIKESNGIEVANVFKLGTRYSDPYGLFFVDARGDKKPVIMGSYGIGPSRIMGAMVEVFHDEKGMVWEESVAPFRAHLIYVKTQSGRGDAKVKAAADKIYLSLQNAGIEVLYDDRKDVSAGEKFNDADLIGIPHRLVISEKTGAKIELKKRNGSKPQLLILDDFIKKYG
ncbi:MAG: hypothetical protein HY456_00095 [Parcubacteria group bacterium]|nr:hypothetical protein [Parcubacteria group bacterium]